MQIRAITDAGPDVREDVLELDANYFDPNAPGATSSTPRCSVSQDMSAPGPAMKPSRDMAHWYWAPLAGSMLPGRGGRHEQTRRTRSGRGGGTILDQHNAWMEEQDAKRTPAEREARRQAQEDQRKDEERRARDARHAAKQTQIGKTGKSLFRTSVWLAVFAIGTVVAWRYGMSHYNPKASASWAEVGRIVGALAVACVTLVLAFVWLAKFFGFLGISPPKVDVHYCSEVQ